MRGLEQRRAKQGVQFESEALPKSAPSGSAGEAWWRHPPVDVNAIKPVVAKSVSVADSVAPTSARSGHMRVI